MLELDKLRRGEEGEKFNLEEGYKWILNEMKFEDFERLFRLEFMDTSRGYMFHYEYATDEKHDTPEAREDYLKYLLYKLYQNVHTPNIRLV